MGIIKIGDSVQLEFGHGDIQVAPGFLNIDEPIGSVSFFNQEKREIGEFIEHEPNELKGIEETPVRMIFEKVESIDVVIWALEEAKKLMIAKENREVERNETNLIQN